MSEPLHHIVIDLETLATTPDASILSIGAAALDPSLKLSQTYSVEIDPRQSGPEYHISADTVLWWMAQSAKARDGASSGKRHVAGGLIELSDWIRSLTKFEPFKVWANPPRMDIAVLEHAFRVEQLPIPWGHRGVLDMRTIRYLVDPEGRLAPEVKDEHTALGDAVWQATYLARLLAQS